VSGLVGLLLVSISVGLSNFAGSIGIGLSGIDARTRIRVGIAFGFFEALMPIIGLLAGQAVAGYLGNLAKYIGGGILIKRSNDEQAALKTQLAETNAKLDETNAKQSKLTSELANTKDPEKIAELQAQLGQLEQQKQQLQLQQQNPTKKPTYGGGGGGGGSSGAKPAGGSGKPCNCTPGDPLCSCL